MLKIIRSQTMFILLILCALGILVFSLFISTPQIADIKISDKLSHVAAYAVLGFLYLRSFNSGKYVIIASIAVCTLYGGLLELLQNLTGRNMELIDFLADLLGAATGSAAGWLSVKIHAGKQKP